MPIRVKCENCKKTLSVKDHLAGKKIKCPVCQTVVAVPAASVPAAPKPPSPAPPAAAPKKAAAVAKPAAKAKPANDPAKTNGTPPPPDKPASNGTPAPPEPVELPPESIEAEAMSAFADEPKPVEEAAPQFIEFTCNWCDEAVKLPIGDAGKQLPCPNPECKRIIKVPLPKVTEKKDWKKMDQRGPAAALINQPEALADAWGSKDVTRAKQTSLAQAGAIEAPVKKRDIFDWIRTAFIVLFVMALLVAGGIGAVRLFSTKQQHNALKDVLSLVEPAKDARVKTPLLAAETHRAVALLYLRERKAAKARDHFKGSLSLVEVFNPDDKNPALNEQFALIDLALAQIEMGGDENEVIDKARVDWEKVREDLSNTLQKIKSPEMRVLAMREVSLRLFEKKQAELALGLASSLSIADDARKRPIPYRQQIASVAAMPGQEGALEKLAPRPDGKAPKDALKATDYAHRCVGYAEGCARKDEFENSLNYAKMPIAPKDKVDGYLGVAAIALQRKNKEQASDAVKHALALAKDKDLKEWHHLQLVRLAVRTGEPAETVAALIKPMSAPFKLRAQLEVFLAACESATGEAPVQSLEELEAADKDGNTLAIAWLAVGRQNARNGITRDRNRAVFDERIAIATYAPGVLDKIRPVIDVGWYLGSMK